jgi:hypothetical protein
MVAVAQAIGKQTVSDETSQAFERILPAIKRFASYAFRHFPKWRRMELVADVVASAYTAFVRLVERGLQCLTYPSALAKYAVRRVRAGRRVGESQNVNDLLSPVAQRTKGFTVERLPNAITHCGWNELTFDRRANPCDIAAVRIDLNYWLRRLTRTKRLVALRLAIGETTSEVAQRFGLSNGRVSQLRRELLDDWNAFQAVPAAA